ncbi:MAG: grasp-with-spasm system SPASM domain peptide maturase [Cyclobacteriaceae bacterium]
MRRFKENDYLILHANCIPVKGASRSIICDLQLKCFHYIPNALYDILSERVLHIKSLYNEFDTVDHDTLDEYIEFLIDKDLGIIDDEPELFPNLSLEWDHSAIVTNSIIDIKADFSIDYNQVFTELSELRCTCVELRFFEGISIKSLDTLLSCFLDSTVRDIRLLIEHDSIFTKEALSSLFRTHARISQLLFFNAETDQVEKVLGVPVIYTSKKGLSPQSCGNTCMENFSINIEHFTEALHFNSCLNRKVSLDMEGNIKNCPSQNQSFGHIKNTTLKQALGDDRMRKNWAIKKDDIEVCKDCEYRYICTDCRVFVEDSGNPFSKPIKCDYDPYTATWT